MTTNQAKQQTRTLILGLGALALIRPLMKITGLIHIFGSEAVGSIAMTILISIAWILIVIKKGAPAPILDISSRIKEGTAVSSFYSMAVWILL